jgi:acetate---CoA ligase (ADP-forming)
MPIQNLSRLIFPKSVAFIGGHECAVAIQRCHDFGFPGEMHAVHPTRAEISGVHTVTSVDNIEGPIDAAFVAVKREATIDVVRQLRAKGCGGAVIYAAGFAETGDDQLQQNLLIAADGMPLMGPNCYGFVNGLGRVALWPDEHGIKPLERGIAIITQSGNIACNMTFTRRALPLAAVFTIGNQADVDMARMIEYLSADDRITAIGLHVEGVTNIAAFAAACAVARDRRKPIVVLKTGRSVQGAKTAQSHTASLAGADQLFDALFKRYGVARVSSITAFVETLKFLHHGGPLSGARLVSLSCSGGEAALAADMALRHNVSFPRFSKDTKARVEGTLNDYVSIENPLDYHTFIWNDEDKLLNTFTAVQGGGFDVGMLILDTPTQAHMNPKAWEKTARAFKTASLHQNARAAVVATLPECLPEAMAKDLATANVAPMHGLDDALTAFESAAFIGRNWAGKASLPALANPITRKGKPVLLSEYEAKKLLKSFGLPVPKSAVCKAADAVKTANKIGYPVTLKISSSTLAHKTEAGGVILNLKTASDVKTAAAKLSKLGPELLVEQMITDSICELIIGITRDPQFGLALVIGAGGVLTELLQDTATLLLPTTPAEIKTACESLRVWQLVKGYRSKKGDTKAVYAAIKAVTIFAAAHADSLEALDVNPLLVLPERVVAVDALVRLRR